MVIVYLGVYLSESLVGREEEKDLKWRWKDAIERDFNVLRTGSWRLSAQNRSCWRNILDEASSKFGCRANKSNKSSCGGVTIPEVMFVINSWRYGLKEVSTKYSKRYSIEIRIYGFVSLAFLSGFKIGMIPFTFQIECISTVMNDRFPKFPGKVFLLGAILLDVPKTED